MSKPKVVKDYEKLPDEIKEQLKLVYPKGFTDHLVSFTNKDGERKLGLPFETDDYYYLIRMTINKATSIIEEDDDYDDDGILKDFVREEYQEKYSDVDYLDSNGNEDNEYEDD